MKFEDFNLGMKVFESQYAFTFPDDEPIMVRVNQFPDIVPSKLFDGTTSDVYIRTVNKIMNSTPSIRFAYHIFDEVSFLISDYDSSRGYMGNRAQRVNSIFTSAFTASFNDNMWGNQEKNTLFETTMFTIPEDNLYEYLLWRQILGIRRSIKTWSSMKFNVGMHNIINYDGVARTSRWEQELINKFRHGLVFYRTKGSQPSQVCRGSLQFSQNRSFFDLYLSGEKTNVVQHPIACH